MRKFTLFMMFSLVCFSLFGQATREPKIFIAPIEGYGRDADSDYLFKRLTYEVILQYHTVVKVMYESDFVFKGTIEFADEMSGESLGEQVIVKTDTNNPVPNNPTPSISNDFGRREFFSMVNGDALYFFDSSGTDNTAKVAVKGTASSDTDDNGKDKKYSFRVNLTDNNTGVIISKQNFIFVTADSSVDKLISTAVTNLLADMPAVPSVKPDDVRDRWMYVETSALWTPKFYYDGYGDTDSLSFGIRLGLELQFLSFMSLGVGAQITNEQVVTEANTYADFILETPILLKGVFKLNRFFTLEPYGGASWNYALLNTIQPSMFSWIAGVQFGIKEKNETGLFVFDARLSMDLSNSAILSEGIIYKHFSVQLGIGYKFGFFQKGKKAK